MNPVLTPETPTATRREERLGRPVKLDQAQVSLDRQAKALADEANPKHFRGDPDGLFSHVCYLTSIAAGINPLTNRYRYTPEDVRGWHDRAESLGCLPNRVGPQTIVRIFRMEKVPNALLRDEFVRQRDLGLMTSHRLAEAIGELKNGKGMRVERMLGLRPVKVRGTERMRLFLDYDQAVAICRALNAVPAEVGV